MTHFGDIVLDEIALEGLDGITLSTLWTRLKARLKTEDICYGRVPVSKETYEYIWEICRDASSIYAYVLPAPRPHLVIFHRFVCVDEEARMPCEPSEPVEDIYPVKSIEDKLTGNRGSCAEYHTRVEVTQEIRNMSFEQVSRKWGDALVLVASQVKRNRALLGPNWNPTFILKRNEYLILERIGRARYLGELSVGKFGLGALNIPLKSCHHYRKELLKHNLVTKQGFFSRNTQGNIVSCLLLHLTRFFTEHVPNLMTGYIHLVKHLKTIPNHTIPTAYARNQVSMPLKNMLRLSGLKKRVLSIKRVPYRSVYPAASEVEYSLKGKVGEKTISVLQLVEPDIREQDLLKTPNDDEEMEDDDDGVEGILDMTRIVRNYRTSLSRLAYEVIREAGPQGLSQRGLESKLGLSSENSSRILLYLTRYKFVNLVTLQVKRQKVFMYIAPMENENQILSDLKPSISGTSTYQRPRPLQKTSKQISKCFPELEISSLQGEINAYFEDKTLELETGDQIVDMEGEECEAENVSIAEQPAKEGIVVAESMVNDVLVTETMNTVYQRIKERVTKTLDVESKGLRLITNSKKERLGYLREIINTEIVVSGSVYLRKEIINHEKQSGKFSYGTICKKTLWSLLAELELKGEISVYFFQISGPNKQNSAEFICKKGVTKEHAEIRRVLEQTSLKLCALMRKSGVKRSAIIELEEGVPHLNKRRKANEERTITISSSRSDETARQRGSRWNNCKFFKRKGKSQTIPASEKMKRKRVSIYDEKDQISHVKMTSLRVKWSEKEDEALMLAQAISCYLSLNNMSVRNRLVPGFAVRDILHKVLPEIAKNKTASACTRRIKFFIKNQSLLFSEANLISEKLSCDPEINKKYPPITDVRTKFSGRENNNQELYNRFMDLFIYLYSRLKDRPIFMLTMLLGSSVSLPNTLHEFHSCYEISNPVTRSLSTHQHQVVQNDYDVTQLSLQSVIFSIYMNVDEMSRACQLHDICERYTHVVTREPINNLKASGVLSKVKNYEKTAKTVAFCTNMKYRISTKLIHQLRGKYQSDFFATVDADAFTSRNIKSVYENSSQLSLDEYQDVSQKESGFNTIYTFAETIFKFKSIVEIPDELIVLNPDQLSKIDNFDEIFKQLEVTLVKMGMDKEKARSVLEAEKLFYPKNAMNQETISFDRITERENLQEESVPILLTNNVSIINQTRKDTNLVNRLLNAVTKHLTLSTDSDHFVIRACPLNVNILPHGEKNLPALSLFIDDGELKSTKKCQMTATVREKSKIEEMIISKSRVKWTKEEIKEQLEELTKEFVRVEAVIHEVIAYIASKKAVGVTKLEVTDEFYLIPKPELARIILKLLQQKLIYKVGNTCVRYISYKFATKWAFTYHLKSQNRETLPSLNPEKGKQMSEINEAPRKGKRLSKEAVEPEEKQRLLPAYDKFFVILRPWINVDGSVNWPGLSFMLLSILSHIMDRPGATMTEIADNFLPSLVNIITYDLIEILEEIHCITRYVIMKQPVSLFSKNNLIPEIRPVNELDLEKEIQVEAAPESAVKLALLMHGSFSSHTSYKCLCH
ncbi:hypothetical protein QYM36_004610 [Artemia franciscana]|uniref:B-block binding subunit of TFIIIC domain-containing protein n=1 Tax=Artemia franciscana TaxID=6661 RepID=A0AA88IAT6_ARTSF|nr:hypothetical protein QYM36_004610 [Artemia franciscana]